MYVQCMYAPNMSRAMRKHAFIFLSPYPKKDWLAGSRQSFFAYDADYKILLCCLHRLYSVVGTIPKEVMM